jgi:hypothetical protein
MTRQAPHTTLPGDRSMGQPGGTRQPAALLRRQDRVGVQHRKCREECRVIGCFEARSKGDTDVVRPSSWPAQPPATIEPPSCPVGTARTPSPEPALASLFATSVHAPFKSIFLPSAIEFQNALPSRSFRTSSAGVIATTFTVFRCLRPAALNAACAANPLRSPTTRTSMSLLASSVPAAMDPKTPTYAASMPLATWRRSTIIEPAHATSCRSGATSGDLELMV